MKRALTQARGAGAIETWGDAALAARLAAALDVTEDEPRTLTHGFHSYPARLHPATARRAIAALGLEQGKVLLDPFCGSGTVLVEAQLAGLTAQGRDISPLAVLISRARCWTAPGPVRARMVARAKAVAQAVIAEGKAARRSGHEPAPERKKSRVPMGAFAPHVRREVEALAASVDQGGDDVGEVLRAILSSIVIKVSRRTSDTRAETTDRAVGRGQVARLFVARAEELAAGLEALAKRVPPRTPRPNIIQGDARRVDLVAGTVDAVVTSPPYAGTYDYAEQHDLRLAVLGLPGFADKEIGARSAFAEDARVAATAWERDLGRVLAEMARVLRPGGKAALVLGDSAAGRPPHGFAVLVRATLERLAPASGLTLVAGAAAPRDKLGTFERAAFGRSPKQEHLIVLSR